MNSVGLMHLEFIYAELALIVAAMVFLLVGAFKDKSFAPKVMKFAMMVVWFTFAYKIFEGAPQESVTLLSNMLIVNEFTYYCKLLILLATGLVLFMASSYYEEHLADAVSEFAVLVLLACAGMLLMVSSNHLLSLYMSLELQSLSLYLLASIHRDHVKSSEAGLKYFVLGSLASGMLLFGISYIYGFTGVASFDGIAAALTNAVNQQTMVPLGLLLGMVCLLIGFCFKISAVPFHMWTPDVYQGAPTVVTSFFASAPKVAAVALLARVLTQAFGDLTDQWQQIIIFVSIASMVVGALGALQQSNIKRLLAFSSIGHVGFLLVGIAAGSHQGIQAVLIYLAVYVLMSLGMFAIVLMIRDKEGAQEDLTALSGLAKQQPALAFAIAVLMLSMAGIPPLAGFFGKFYIFMAAVEAELYTLAIIGVLSSVLSAFYYLRVIKLMYFDQASTELVKGAPLALTSIAAVSVAFNMLLCIHFAPLVDAGKWAASSLF